MLVTPKVLVTLKVLVTNHWWLRPSFWSRCDVIRVSGGHDDVCGEWWVRWCMRWVVYDDVCGEWWVRWCMRWVVLRWWTRWLCYGYDAETTYYGCNVSVIIQAVPRADGVPLGQVMMTMVRLFDSSSHAENPRARSSCQGDIQCANVGQI